MYAAEHEIGNLRVAPGRLEFEARVGDLEPVSVHFEAAIESVPGPEAALATCVMPAMAQGGRLRLQEPVSARVLRGQREFQSIQAAWSRQWDFVPTPLREVTVEAPSREPAARRPTGRVGAFFSGGVDSFATVLANPDVTDLIFVRGFDIIDRIPSQAGLADRVEARLREAAAELGRGFIVVDTNLREVADPFVDWVAFYGNAAVAVAHFLGGEFDRVLIAGDTDYEVQAKLGANHLVDQLWSSEDLEIVDDGGRFNRMQRIELFAADPVARRHLRVCWENEGGAYNCGHCRKCLMTMAGLELAGVLAEFESFPDEIDHGALAAIEIAEPISLSFWEDLAGTAAGRGDELESAIATVHANAKANLGLAPGFRRRSVHAPAPDAADSRLFASPETVAALERAGAVVLLLGGYDGSGNFGDIALLEAALELLARFEVPGLLALPVLERGHAAQHQAALGDFVSAPAHALYFDSEGDREADDGLVAAAPRRRAFAASYLYGGGYLNGFWGDRKLAMLEAAEKLLGGAPARISSGLQLQAAWLASLEPERRERLRAYAPLGVRDAGSASAVGAAGWEARASGDDAVGVFPLGDDATAPDPDRPLLVNVHLGEHEHVSDRPGSLAAFEAAILRQLADRAGAPLRLRPLVAYSDRQRDDRTGAEGLAAELRGAGFEVEEPLLVRTSTLRDGGGFLAEAALTISCSFHVALASLLLGVPAALLADNEYYRQKAAGLRQDFRLPVELAPSLGDDPAVVAAALHDFAVVRPAALENRERLRRAAGAVVARRGNAEAELLGRLGGAVLAAGAAHTAADPRPLELRARTAELREQEATRLRTAAEGRQLEAEARASAAEAAAGAAATQALAAAEREAGTRAELAAVFGTTSWRLTEPLRRFTRRLRGR